MRLFHFSDDPSIERFEPRPVRIPSARPPGRDWLNGPLVWAVDEAHQPLYLFPRDCPRILVWPTPDTTAEDRAIWWADRACRMVAHVEAVWLVAVRRGRIYRYEMPADAFEPLDDAGMWVARGAVDPLGLEAIDDLPAALASQGVELVVASSLAPLRRLWGTSLHVSGLRLRNAKDWEVGG